MRTYGATGTVVDALAVGVSGAMRWFRVPEFAERPTAAVTALGWAFSVDALVPILCAGPGDLGNALTVTSSFADGAGDADFYTALNGGITFPPLPNPSGITPAPSYAPNVDNGLVVFDGAGELVAIRWWSFIAGVQYYLPPSGRIWLSLNYSHLHSPNIARLGTPAAVFATSNWVDGNLLFDATRSVRFGVAYGFSEQTYGDGVKAHNHRVQVSGFFFVLTRCRRSLPEVHLVLHPLGNRLGLLADGIFERAVQRKNLANAFGECRDVSRHTGIDVLVPLTEP